MTQANKAVQASPALRRMASMSLEETGAIAPARDVWDYSGLQPISVAVNRVVANLTAKYIATGMLEKD